VCCWQVLESSRKCKRELRWLGRVARGKELEAAVSRRAVSRGPGTRQWVRGEDLRIADEVRYIQRRAAEHTVCFVTFAKLAFFATETADAWMLDVEDHLANRLARDGQPQEVHIEDTGGTRYTILWRGLYAVEGDLFVYRDAQSGGVTSILGYPAARIAALG
jgi:hypothetical protein